MDSRTLAAHARAYFAGSLGLAWRILLLAVLFNMAGCAYLVYEQTPPGKLHGNLIVEWYGPDKFLILPDESNPLTFVRANGEIIRPQMMYNDSGQLPRSLWVSRSYSPWGYTPAFVIHDWLYEMNHCRLANYQSYDADSAADIMAEVIKTLMADPLYGGRNSLNLYALYRSAKSSAARHLWDTGICDSHQLEAKRDFFEYPIARFSVQF